MAKELEQIRELLESGGCVVESESLLTSDMLHITAVDGEELPYTLAVGIYPDDEEGDETLFIQFYFQYSTLIDGETIGNLVSDIASTNRLLPLGHFNIVPDEQYIYFKYVLVSTKERIEQAVLADVLHIIVYVMEEMRPSGTESL